MINPKKALACVMRDAEAVFGYRKARPQERAHKYLADRRITRKFTRTDTALLAVCEDLCRRSYQLGRHDGAMEEQERRGQ